MWTIAASNKKFSGPLGSYNGLTDVHLAHYFSRPFRQGHLKAARLITSDGIIVPEQKFKMSTIEYEKQRKSYEILANSVVQNAIHKKGSWKKKLCNCLEDVSKIEKVEKIKTGPKRASKCELSRSLKGNSAVPLLPTYNINRLLQDLDYVKAFPRLSHSASVCFKDGSAFYTNSTELKRCWSAKEESPYCTSWLNTCHHKPHSNCHQTKESRRKKKKSKKTNKNKQPQLLGSNLIESTKLNKLTFPEKSLKSNPCKITLFYYGHTPLKNSQTCFTEEVLIRQQHCGGTSVIIYKGPITPNETLTFISLNHEEYAFSITLFLDGIRYLKLSTCCIFRYPIKKRLGGSSGNFSIHSIEGGRPCLKCQYNEMEAKNTSIIQKIKKLEDSKPLQNEIVGLHSNGARSERQERDQEKFPATNYKNYESEDAESLVEFDILNSLTEEIEENLENELDNPKGKDIKGNKNELVEDEVQFEEENISVEEDFVESSYDSEPTNSVAVSVKDVDQGVKQFQVSPYASESSDEETGKSHVIMASVHGSPTTGL